MFSLTICLGDRILCILENYLPTQVTSSFRTICERTPSEMETTRLQRVDGWNAGEVKVISGLAA